jgi:putative heme-binding domain-containing protein
MKLMACSSAFLLFAAAIGLVAGHSSPGDAPGAFTAPAADAATGRRPWTTSTVTGSPEPPRPFKIARAFPKLTFRNPLLFTNAPGSDRLFVGEQYGKLFSFKNDPAVARADLFFDLNAELSSWDKAKVKGVGALYGLTFHPAFAKNRTCYVCYVLDSKKDGEQLPDGSRVSRFTVTDTDPPRIDPKSEKVLITWMAGGHNGGDLHFGNDGFLYISAGDAADPNPPDRFDTGQDISDLLSSVLRIDVDREENGKPYAVPKDNPFHDTPGARPEVYAYGFRNPWRMSFDRPTGDLWVGDVGWELWEMIYRVQKGGNYGWSVMEGRQQVRPEAKRGPTPILPPALDFPHSEAASITGGYVYRGKKLKDLVGAYICGDWMTRKLWATRFDGDKVVWHKEIAQGSPRIVAFGLDNDNELYFLDYNEQGGVYQLVPNDASQTATSKFPTRLSETGLFASVKDQQPAAGVYPFAINAEQWSDYATAERFVGLPGESTVRLYDTPQPVPNTAFYNGRVFFARDGVLARTVSLELERGNPASRRRLETQLLHYDGDDWKGYTYQWNDEQTDATLVPAAGADRMVTVTDPEAPGGKRLQKWHYLSRAECVTCHNPWAGYLLSFTAPQLTRGDQLATFKRHKLVTQLDRQNGQDRPSDKPTRPLVNPYDDHADVTARARSYLQVNCSHCHQFGAGGTADIELRYEEPLEKMKLVGVRPVQGTFEIHGAHLLSPGDPYRSVLFYRMAKLGRGRMPHIGSDIVDERGLRLLEDWISKLPVPDKTKIPPSPHRKDELALLDKVCTTDAGRPEAVDKLLASTTGALLLARAVAEGKVPEAARQPVVTAGVARPEPQVHDLFERFLPDDQRVQRLGSVVNVEDLLKRKGDPARGKELFLKAAATQCINCHRVAGTGSTLGPDLSDIGKKQTRAQILESLLEPSKKIDPQYVTYLCETTDGLVYTGLLGDKTKEVVVLKNAGDKEVRVPAAKVEKLVPQKNSLMPEGLLRDLTAEQVADLLEYLAGLK